MSVSELRSTAIPTLPADLSGDARLYLRPLGLLAAPEAQDSLGARTGLTRPLAGGVFAFTRCEVSIREPGRIRSVTAPVREIEAWAARLGGRTESRVARAFTRLAAARVAPDGSPLRRPLLMGVINATPDSFSDGGQHLDAAAAIKHGQQLAQEGADILDLGGESVRPGAVPVEASVELARVVPVLDGLAEARSVLGGALVSIDTRKPEVMRAALVRGARVVNDVTALTGHPDSLDVAVGSDATIVLMHMQGEPATMNLDPRYENAALDVFDYLEARIAACVDAGIARERLIVDPGIGFGKRGRHNLDILRSLALYHGLGVPLLIGVSRKGLTGELDRARPPEERLPGSLAAAVYAVSQGAQLLRVHDVAATRQALDVWERLVGLSE